MSINRKIIKTLSPYVPVVVPDFYEGDEETYVTFNVYLDRGSDYGDSVPTAQTAYVHIHLYAPNHTNILDLIGQIRMTLLDAGFSWPDVERGADKDYQHVVFDAQIEDDETIQKLDERK